jgi:CRP/FNR family transcriptional regulator, cyclic AMP receptor protein
VSQTTDSLSSSELFEGLTDAALADIDGRLRAAGFRKGELIYSPFDRGDALYLIEAGRVRLYRSAQDGRQLTLAMLDEGEAFGLVPVNGDDLHDAYAEAMSDCVLRVVPAADLERTAAEHPQVALNLMRSLSQRLRSVEDRLESLAFRGVAARLAGQLLELMERYGRVTPQGIRIDERFTHMQLAEMIGTSRETLTKVLNELRESGLIDVRERLVWVLDADGLEHLKTAG